ncbi:MAG TPA: RidA family protein [Chthoniobacteraceae bacterium]|nr:RidA family protein [Chthoniobacteraceae bacterium]
MKDIAHPDKAFQHGRFSSAIECDGWLHISGQGPLDMKTGQRVAGTIEEETQLTLEHIEKILHAAGYQKSDIVKCTCYLRDMDDFDGFNRQYAAFFNEPLPARTTVGAVLMKGIRVEIDAIARRRNVAS